MSTGNTEKLKAIYDALSEAVLNMSSEELNEWKNSSTETATAANQTKLLALEILKRAKKGQLKKHRESHDNKANSFVSTMLSIPGTYVEKLELLKQKVASLNLALQFREFESISEEDLDHFLRIISDMESRRLKNDLSEKKDDE